MNRLSRMMLLGMLAIAPAIAAGDPLPATLQPLDRAIGRWVYHGGSVPASSPKATHWTWYQDCGWSANRLFLACSFTMDWPDKVVHSLSVSTFNTQDKSYWHYEMFDSDGTGDKPFISRMTIDGDTWTQDGEPDVDEHGKKVLYRVVYHFDSPKQVTVKIEMQGEAGDWTVLEEGVGVKQS